MSELEIKSNPTLKWMGFFSILLAIIAVVWIGFRIALPANPTIFAGERPTNLGVKEGKLAPCPNKPNCVNSQSEDSEHKIEPLNYNSRPETAISTLKQIIQGSERTKVISETDNYLYAEFASRWMGYVDDVEFFANSDTGKIEVRSASRLGESDLGVNRQRIEEIREKFNATSAG